MRVIVKVSTAVKDESLAVNYIWLTSSVGGVPESVVLPLKVKSSELNYSQYEVGISVQAAPSQY